MWTTYRRRGTMTSPSEGGRLVVPLDERPADWSTPSPNPPTLPLVPLRRGSGGIEWLGWLLLVVWGAWALSGL